MSRSELAEARRKPPASLESYICVFRAYEYIHVHDELTHREARECLEVVVERDPDYAEGWAWLAYMYAEEHHHRRNERPESYDAMDRAMEVAERAVRLNPTSQMSQGALAMTQLMRGDLERGRVTADRTIELNPNSVWWLGIIGWWLSVGGDFERGVPLSQKAMALDPNQTPWLRMSTFLEHYYNGRFEAALTEALVVETGDYRTSLFRAATYGQLGRSEEAARALAEMRTQSSLVDEDVRRDLIERNGFAPDLVERLMNGLRKAGF